MRKVLGSGFFNRDTAKVAEELLGCFLVRRRGRKTRRFLIKEVEVYNGFNDRASHASRGKTERNKIMFGGPGNFYVYFTYGIHWMLNIVTREKEYPAAILIRAVNGYDGPAKLTKALGIDKKFNGRTASVASGLWFERGIKISKNQIKKLSRVGVTYAGPVWAKRKLRFLLLNN